MATVSQPQTRLAGVAEPSENASWLIADVQIDNGFPLELGVTTPKVARLQAGSQGVLSVGLSGGPSQRFTPETYSAIIAGSDWRKYRERGEDGFI